LIRVLALAAILLAPTLSVATTQSANRAHRFVAAPGGPPPSAAPGGDGVIGAPVGVEGERPLLGDQTVDLGGAPGARSQDMDLGPYSGQPTDALPLSRFAGADPRPPPLKDKDGFDLWDLINRVRSGGLPEPASWALMLLGFGMIGAALRGFVVANRRLARLQPEESDDSADP
jgi:hypothetical protein